MLVNQVLLVSVVPFQHIRPKHVCQLYVPRQGAQHNFFFNSQQSAIRHCAGRGRTGRLTSDGIFADKIAVTQYAEDCFLPSWRFNAEFYLSLLNDKHSMCRIIQRVNRLPLRETHHLPPSADGCEKRLRAESGSLLGHRSAPSLRSIF